MKIAREWPLRSGFRSAMDRLFDDFFSGPPAFRREGGAEIFLPALDIRGNEEMYV